MTEKTPDYLTDNTEWVLEKSPIKPSQQTVEHWLMVYKNAHEVGLIAQRQLELVDSLPSESKLFLTRKERRHPSPE